MSFSISYHNLPSIQTYAQAEQHFEKIKPVRGWVANGRPLARRSDSTKLIVRHEVDGQVVYSCQYHATNCVTFFPNGVVHLHPYGSQNTDMFVTNITGIMTRYSSSLGPCISLYGNWADRTDPAYAYEHRQYLLSDCALDNGLEVVRTGSSWRLCNEERDTQPIPFYRVNRAVANAAYRAAGLTAFTAWVKMASTMAPQVFETDYASLQRHVFLDTDLPLLRAEHQSEWAGLALTYGPDVLEKARAFVIRETPEAIHIDYRPFITLSEEKAARASYLKYGAIPRL